MVSLIVAIVPTENLVMMALIVKHVLQDLKLLFRQTFLQTVLPVHIIQHVNHVKMVNFLQQEMLVMNVQLDGIKRKMESHFVCHAYLVSINMKQVKMAALNAMKGRFKSWQATPRALTVQLAGAMQVVGLLDATLYHPDLILTMKFNIFVNVVTLVPELIHHQFHVQQGNTPTLMDQYHVFHVLPENLQKKMVVLNVLDARKDIFNLNRNNLPVKKFNLVQS
jgi:hypothetical protein